MIYTNRLYDLNIENVPFFDSIQRFRYGMRVDDN